MNLTSSFGNDSTSIREELSHSQRLNLQVNLLYYCAFPKANLIWIIINSFFLSCQALKSKNARSNEIGKFDEFC